MQNQQSLSLSPGPLSSPQHHILLNRNQDQQQASGDHQFPQHQDYVSPATRSSRQYSVFNKVPENSQFSHIFHKYSTNYIRSALALFRDEEDLLRPFERFSDVEMGGIVRLLRTCPEKLVAVLDIWADDRSFIQEFKDYEDTDIQKMSEQLRTCILLRREYVLKESLGNHIRTLPNPLEHPAKRLRTQSLSRVQHLSQPGFLHDKSPASLPLSSTQIPKEAGHSDQPLKFRCTYDCGNTFKKQGHRNNHELNHHDGKRKISCQHTGCKVEVDTEPAYTVHHNRIHKYCEVRESCGRSGKYLRPPKTASSCGYCGKLFEGESNFKDRSDHIKTEHHSPKAKDHKTAREWSRNVQLEGKNGAEGMFSRQELVSWRVFREERTQLQGISTNFSWEQVPKERWINLLELIEHGATIDNGPQWGFTDDVVQVIFEEAFKLAVHHRPGAISSHYTNHAAHPNVEPSAFLCITETSYGNAMLQPPDSGDGDCGESNNLDANVDLNSALHQWKAIDYEGQCRFCHADDPTQYTCRKCNLNSCESCKDSHGGFCEYDAFNSFLVY